MVTTIDKHGDAYIRILSHPGVSKEKALQILREKKAELAAGADINAKDNEGRTPLDAALAKEG